ncbi:MAG: hypothetical protein K5682_03700 [Lachnospiraceae bacterium]|nr:hypothetical protein [Lachnospiraceae bacterium]
MQYCPKCKIHIKGNKQCCPLCQGRLEGEGEDPIFPVLKRPRVSSVTAFKICVFIWIIVLLVMFTVDYMTGNIFAWPGVVRVAATFGIIDVAISMYYHSNVLKLVTIEVYMGMLAGYYVDLHTGFYGWSLSWMIPACFVGLVILTLILGSALHLYIVDYVIYLVVDVVASLIQLIPIHKELNPFPYAAVASMAMLLGFASFIVLFRFKDLKNASSKYMNI